MSDKATDPKRPLGGRLPDEPKSRDKEGLPRRE